MQNVIITASSQDITGEFTWKDAPENLAEAVKAYGEDFVFSTAYTLWVRKGESAIRSQIGNHLDKEEPTPTEEIPDAIYEKLNEKWQPNINMRATLDPKTRVTKTLKGLSLSAEEKRALLEELLAGDDDLFDDEEDVDVEDEDEG